MTNRTTRRTVRTGLALSAALGLGLLATGCGSDDNAADTTPTVTVTRDAPAAGTAGGAVSGTAAPTTATAPAATATDTPTAGSGTGTTVDAAAALTTALDARPGSYAVEIDEEDGRFWELTLVDGGDGVELTVDRSSGEVVGERPTSLDPEQKDAPKVTAADAVATALADKPGELDSLDLDRERGQVAWEATVISGREEWNLWIDPATGEIVNSELDD